MCNMKTDHMDMTPMQFVKFFSCYLDMKFVTQVTVTLFTGYLDDPIPC